MGGVHTFWDHFICSNKPDKLNQIQKIIKNNLNPGLAVERPFCFPFSSSCTFPVVSSLSHTETGTGMLWVQWWFQLHWSHWFGTLWVQWWFQLHWSHIDLAHCEYSGDFSCTGVIDLVRCEYSGDFSCTGVILIWHTEYSGDFSCTEVILIWYAVNTVVSSAALKSYWFGTLWIQW